MIRITKRALVSAAVVATVLTAPTTALARFNLNPGGASQVQASSPAVDIAPALPGSTAVAPSSEGFQWDDAAVGAAGAVVVVLGAGALGSGVQRRRRVHRSVG